MTSKHEAKPRKTARIVEIPDDRPLTFSEFDELKNHAVNSSIWQVNNYPRNSNQLRKKLRDKGYPEEPVLYVDTEGNLSEYDFIESTIETLESLSWVDDRDYVIRRLDSYVSSGVGPGLWFSKLLAKEVDPELAKECIEEYQESHSNVNAQLSREMMQVIRSSKYKNEENEFKRKQIITTRLARKGFSFNDISNEYENYLEPGDENGSQ